MTVKAIIGCALVVFILFGLVFLKIKSKKQ